MPWSPTPVEPTSPVYLAWSPTGPEAPADESAHWWPVQPVPASDSGIGMDTASLFAHLTSADTATGIDTAALLAHLNAADSATGQDSTALLAHLSGWDSGTGIDSGDWLLHLDASGADAGTGSDTAGMLPHLAASDDSAGQDVASAFAHLAGGDAGTGEDTARPAYMNPYSSSKAATTVPHAVWTDLLTYTAAGNGTATVTFTIAHSWGSNGFHFASETRGIRVLVNGTQVAIQTQTYTTGSWSTTLTQSGVTVPAGANVQIQGYGETTIYTACRTVTISSAAMTVNSVT